MSDALDPGKVAESGILNERRVSWRNDSAFMLALLYTSGFIGLAFLVVIRGVQPDGKEITQQLISIMSMIQAAIAGYFYGASRTAAVTANKILDQQAAK